VNSRSLKVIEFGTNRKGMRLADFLFVANSKLGRFGATSTYWSKSPLRHIPLSHLTPLLGVMPCEYVDELSIDRN